MALRAIGVERVHRVVLRRDINNVVHMAIVHQNTAGIKRLPDDDAVDTLCEELSETIHVDVRGRQQGLIRIQTRPRVVVVLSQDIVLPPGHGKSQAEEENNGQRCNRLWTRHMAHFSITIHSFSIPILQPGRDGPARHEVPSPHGDRLENNCVRGPTPRGTMLTFSKHQPFLDKQQI